MKNIDLFYDILIRANIENYYIKTSNRFLTFFFHVDGEAFFEPACLTLVPSRHIHNASAVFFANIVEVPGEKNVKLHLVILRIFKHAIFMLKTQVSN